jgi:catechol 2,3-dioxygenase-like lactoylglutathione lyase family enzyme
MRIDAIDHLVLTVRDLQVTMAFYTRVLGMEAVTFGADRRALAFGVQKINLHTAGRELEPKAAAPTPGSADLCFVTSATPAMVLAHLRTCGVQIVEGPVPRTGARGPIVSVYFRDPDGNLLEVSSYASDEQARASAAPIAVAADGASLSPRGRR